MATKKKVSKKSEKPQLCLRKIDANTHMVSDDPKFQPVTASEMEKLPKGMVRVDPNTVVKA